MLKKKKRKYQIDYDHPVGRFLAPMSFISSCHAQELHGKTCHLDYSSSDPKIGRSSWIMCGPRINHMSPWKRASYQMRKKKSKRSIKRHQENNESTRNRARSRLGDGGDHRESMRRKMILPRTTEVGRAPWAPGEKLTLDNTLISASWDPDQGDQLSPRHFWPSELRWYPSVLLGC